MSDFVEAANVLVNQGAATREEALSLISDKAVELGVAHDAKALCQDFLAREAMGETGMTDGFAIPHAKSAAVDRAAIVVFKNRLPLKWPSFDEKPIHTAIAIMVPESEEGTEHIRLLSRAAELLMNSGFKNLVAGSSDPAQIAAAVNDGISK